MDISLVYTLIGITIFIIVFFSIPANIKLRKKLKLCNIKTTAIITKNDYEIGGIGRRSNVMFAYKISYIWNNITYNQIIPAKILKRIFGPIMGIQQDINKDTTIYINPNNPNECISQNEKINTIFLCLFLPILPLLLVAILIFMIK